MQSHTHTHEHAHTHTHTHTQVGVGVVTPFRRVGEDVSVDPRLQDNSFEAKGGARGSWGERANKDLKFTKGMCTTMLAHTHTHTHSLTHTHTHTLTYTHTHRPVVPS